MNLHTPLPTVSCLPIQIEQVIVNLLINGYEAMDGLPRDQRVMTISTVSAGDRVRVSVTDSGEGIPAHRIGHVFDIFHTSKLDGTGLGLPLGQSIVENQGGMLWVESSDGNGATFILEMPVIEGGDPA